MTAYIQNVYGLKNINYIKIKLIYLGKARIHVSLIAMNSIDLSVFLQILNWVWSTKRFSLDIFIRGQLVQSMKSKTWKLNSRFYLSSLMGYKTLSIYIWYYRIPRAGNNVMPIIIFFQNCIARIKTYF